MDLLASMALVPEGRRLPEPGLIRLGLRLINGFEDISDAGRLTAEERDLRAWEMLSTFVPELLEHSKCPDFIVNRGHYFGSSLAESDKGYAQNTRRFRAGRCGDARIVAHLTIANRARSRADPCGMGSPECTRRRRRPSSIGRESRRIW